MVERRNPNLAAKNRRILVCRISMLTGEPVLQPEQSGMEETGRVGYNFMTYDLLQLVVATATSFLI